MNWPPNQEIEHCQNLRSALCVLPLYCSFPGLEMGESDTLQWVHSLPQDPSAYDYFFLNWELLFYLHPRLTCISLPVLPILQVLRLLLFHILPSRNPPPPVLHLYQSGSQEIDHALKLGFPGHEAGGDGWRINLDE